MTLYNIFGTSDEWDEQCLGHIRTIETSNLVEALRHIAEEELLDSSDDDRVEDIRVVEGKEGLQELYDENETSCYFFGEEVAYAVLDRGDFYARFWVAVPVEVTSIVIGEV
jgi:hypothetical protein